MDKNLLKVWPELLKLDQKYEGQISFPIAEWIEMYSLQKLGRHISRDSAPLMPRKDLIKMFGSRNHWEWVREIIKVVDEQESA